MRKFTSSCVPGLMLLLALGAGPASALQVVTEENRPFNYTENGKLTGLSTEVIQEMGRRARVPLTLATMPWPKAYDIAQTKTDACIYSTARLENRERVFKWVGPLATNVWGVFARTGFNEPIKTVADLRPFRIGGVTDDAKVVWLRNNAVTNIVTVREDRLVPPMLTLDRKKAGGVDLWVTGMYSQKAATAAAGVKDIKLVLKLNEESLWLACNPGVPNETIRSLAAALSEMDKDGAYRRIVAAYEKKFAP